MLPLEDPGFWKYIYDTCGKIQCLFKRGEKVILWTLHHAMAPPKLLNGRDNWTVMNEQERIIEAVKIKFLRPLNKWRNKRRNNWWNPNEVIVG